MKKIFYAFATVVAMTAISCSKEADIQTNQKHDPQEVAEKPATLTAQVGDITKVSADNAGVYKWQTSDKITIQTNNGNTRTFTAAEAGLATDFSGSIPETDELDGGYAFYPASDEHAALDSDVSFHIPSELTWSSDASNMPMFSRLTTENEKTNASFHVVGGALKLVCFNIPTGATKLAFTAKSMKICGDFEFDADSETPWCVGEGSDSDKEIITDFSDNYSSNKVFYIPLPVVTLTGGFTITIYNDNLDELFSVTSTKALAVTANKLIIAPALNCAAETVIWKETFTGYSSISPNSSSPTSINTGEGYNAVGDSNITYVLGSNSSVQTSGTMYSGGASSPELLVKSSNPFTVSNIPAGGNTSLELSWYSNRTTLSVTASTADVTVGSITHNGSKHTVTLSIKNSPSTFNLTFSASEKTRFDDVVLAIPAEEFSVPTIASDDEELAIGVGETSASTNVALTNAVDGLGISFVLDGTNADKFTAAIEDGTLTVTAKEASNTSGADYTATLTLKATGAGAKVITLSQANALVPNPTDLKALAGNASATITFSKDVNASSYLAYLHSAATETPATGGTNVTSSLSLDGEKGIYSLELTELTNDQEYYIYVKVNGVEENYVAPSSYVNVTFTPAEEKGTEDNPYWASELYDIVSEYGSGKGPDGTLYVKGYVSTAYAPSSGSQRYYISDNGTTAKQFYVYNGKGISGANITSSNRVKVGDWVVVSGTAQNYSGNLPEFNAGSVIVTHHPKLAIPAFTVEAGTYYMAKSVEINGPAGATVYYTTDGSTPTTSSSTYSGAISVDEDMTIKAFAVKENCVDSDVAEAAYVIAAPTKLSAPEVTASSFSHNSITFSWAAVENATGYAISTDGGTNYGDPQNGTTYTWNGLSASTSYTIYVKAIGTANGQYTDSDPDSCSQTTAEALTLSSIAVTTNPTKMAYSIGESFSLTGAVVTATYSDESTANVTASCTTNYDTPETFTSAGESVVVTISYTEGGLTKTVDLDVLVSERYEKVTDLKDVTAGEYVIVNDGYYLPNAVATNAGPEKTNNQKVTISNSNSVDIVSGVTSDMTWTFTGTAVTAMTIESTKSTSNNHYYLWVSGNGNNYLRVGGTSHTWTVAVNGSAEAFSLKDNSYNRYCATYSQGADWRSYNTATAGNYGDDGKLYFFKLVDNTTWDLKSITVKTAPSKVTYAVGEYFDPTGLVITATYSDHDGVKADKTVDVAYSNATAEAFTFTPSTSTALSVDDDDVSITWGGKSTSQNITVTAGGQTLKEKTLSATFSSHSGWTVSGTGGTSYWVLKSNAYITSPSFSFNSIKKVVIKTRTYGGADYKTTNVYYGSTLLGSVDASGTSLANKTLTVTSSPQPGTGSLTFRSSTTTSSYGPGVSEITITYDVYE